MGVGRRHEAPGHVVAEERDSGGMTPVRRAASAPPVSAPVSASASVVCTSKAICVRSTAWCGPDRLCQGGAFLT